MENQNLLNDNNELTTYHAIITTDKDGVLVTFPIVELEYEFDTMEEAEEFIMYVTQQLKNYKQNGTFI